MSGCADAAGAESGTYRMRLFCFPHAGAGISCFTRWQQVIGTVAEVVPVLLPGRESKIREPRVTDPGRLLAMLLDSLAPLLDRPFLLYGHSLGGHVAHAFAQSLKVAGLRVPERVVLGAALPPHRASPLLPPAASPSSGAAPSDAELLKRLVSYGMLPQGVLEEPAGGIWQRSVLPVLRDDIRLAEALRTRDTGPLAVPVLAVAGAEDMVAPAAEVAEWRRFARAGFAMRIVPGGHLFVRARPLPELLRDEAQRLEHRLRSCSSTV